MTHFTKEDLAYTGYSQTVDLSTNKNITEIIERIYVDKTEEFEVVNFCNQFLQRYKVPKTRASFQKVESLLQHQSLENQVYREELLDWIASNWVKI